MGGGKRGVHVGRDGWLFWLGESGQVPRLYSGGPRAWLRVRRWRRLLAERERRCAKLGARFVQVFAPDKLSVLSHFTKTPLVDPRRGFARRMAKRPPVVDLIEPLRAAGAEKPAYLRTDTHWTAHGYLAAYRALCVALNACPAQHVLSARAQAEVEVALDLGGKLKPPQTEIYTPFDFPRQAERRVLNGLAEWRERHHGLALAPGFLQGSRAVYFNRSTSVDSRRLVVFGDSYVWHPTGLGPMLAETFAEVHLVWMPSLDWDYLEGLRPDIIIHEMAERFARMMPVDGAAADDLARLRLLAVEQDRQS